MRQRDLDFSTVLTKIGSGLQLDARETEMIQKRFVTHEWSRENLPSDVMRLFFNNSDVERYNQNAIPITTTTEIYTASDS